VRGSRGGACPGLRGSAVRVNPLCYLLFVWGFQCEGQQVGPAQGCGGPPSGLTLSVICVGVWGFQCEGQQVGPAQGCGGPPSGVCHAPHMLVPPTQRGQWQWARCAAMCSAGCDTTTTAVHDRPASTYACVCNSLTPQGAPVACGCCYYYYSTVISY